MASRNNTSKNPAQPDSTAKKADQTAQAAGQAGAETGLATTQLGADAAPHGSDADVGSSATGTDSGAPAIEAAAPAAAAAADQVECVIVRSLPLTHRRAGFRFSREPLGIALAVLTPEKLKALEDDPELVVERASFDREVVGID